MERGNVYGFASKKRDSRRNPSVSLLRRELERELQSELELTHTGRGARRSVSFDIGDLAGIASAIDAGVPLVRVEAKHRMIEHVEGIHTELRLHALGNGEVLEERSVRKECTRPAEAVHSNITEVADSGIGERSRQRRQRCEVLNVRIGACWML